MTNKKITTWGHVAQWYDAHLQEEDTYHAKVILPNLMRLVGRGNGKKALDIACGQGYFTRALGKNGFDAHGADIAPELIEQAQKYSNEHGQYTVAPAEKLPFSAHRFEVATCVLALQNIRDLPAAVTEAYRVLAPGGQFIAVLNHPAFRIPKHSSWGWDNEHRTQYRRLDAYMSESHADIEMHPGKDKEVSTVSYHRPLQVYIKTLVKAGFVVTGFEEWISHKVSEKGPRQGAEDKARKEFPFFLCLVATKSYKK
ncbi:class I SAM-dependent methyltransferase [bacterium]|nr:class I SAM-dependent methyltransferase [bacterium]